LLMKYGLPPELMRDLKGLMGDTSDNIPGVPGVGEKTATELVMKFGDIDSIYENIDSPDIRDSVRKKLVEGKESAYLSKFLGTIAQDAPIKFSPEDSKVGEVDNDSLYALFTRLEFKSYITRLGLHAPEVAASQKEVEVEFSETVIKDEKGLSLTKDKLSGKACTVVCDDAFCGLAVLSGEEVFLASRADCGEEIFEELLKFVFSDKTEKTVHDKKMLYRALRKEGAELSNVTFDTALAAYVIDPARKRYDIVSVSHMFGEDLDAEWDSLSDPASFSPLTGSDVGISCLKRCVVALSRMEMKMRERLVDDGMERLYFDIEAPFTDILTDMENEGVTVDAKELAAFGEMLSDKTEALSREIYDVAGEEFNILSPKQLGEILFEKLGIPPVKKTKTGYSTDAEVLAKISGHHAIIPLVLDYRKYTKLKSTYADGLLGCINPADGKIHTTYQQMVTATGRISSTEPNLQNIPIRSELGGEVRRMFVPKSEDYVLIDADYSQIELRVLAHITQDEEMCRAFLEENDIHTETASHVFGVPKEDVTPEMRRVSKAVNFGIVYGISDFSLAEDIGVTRAEAKRYMEAYLERFSGVRAYMKEVVAKAREDGFATTLFGRRRYIPEITSKNFNLRSFGERVALNAPIQGSAADIIKIAMIKVSKRLSEEGLRARLILQVHDELIVEAHREDAADAARILTEEMESAAALSVPLVAEAGVGDTWYEAKK
ncbi:MAG: DNA polymerase I, partial [Oscillospiraceae bacterium]|nr:DNA polymerase I [Oscillospiraceae bacterium]